MENKTQKIRYEFFTYNGFTGTITSYTLSLNQPCEVRFIFTNSIGGFAIINNTYNLESYGDTILGTAVLPYELILKNNLDEIDVTNYQIRIKEEGLITVICKYYVKD